MIYLFTNTIFTNVSEFGADCNEKQMERSVEQ